MAALSQVAALTAQDLAVVALFQTLPKAESFQIRAG
jgi:hypothetical protein